MVRENSDVVIIYLELSRNAVIKSIHYSNHAPWCWYIYQHVPEQNHPFLEVNMHSGN